MSTPDLKFFSVKSIEIVDFRILALYLLNLYTLMFALYWKIDEKVYMLSDRFMASFLHIIETDNIEHIYSVVVITFTRKTHLHLR